MQTFQTHKILTFILPSTYNINNSEKLFLFSLESSKSVFLKNLTRILRKSRCKLLLPNFNVV